MAFDDFKPEDVLIGDKLGSGAFATVYRARLLGNAAIATAHHLGLPLPDEGLPVAVKIVQVLSDMVTLNSSNLQALRAEVQVRS